MYPWNWLKNWRHRQCLLCAGRAEAPLPLCDGCERDLPWLHERCLICALPLIQSGKTLCCGQCLRRPPSFSRVEVPLRYGFPVDTLITRFKHQANAPLGRLLAQLLSRHLEHAYAEELARPAYLLAVPISARRLRQRGFNQAALLARWLASSLGLPWRDDLLRRVQDNPPQQGLDAAQRKANLRQAFSLEHPEQVIDQHLALVDDVLTTGATAEAIASLLRKAGAARVDIYCVARTPAPG